MRKPFVCRLTALAIASSVFLPGLLAQELRPPIDGKKTQNKAPGKAKTSPTAGTDPILNDPTLIRNLGEGLDPTGKSILPSGNGATATTNTSGEKAPDNLLYDYANGKATPLYGGDNYSGNAMHSTLGSTADLLLNTQTSETTPKIPLNQIAGERLNISIDPTEVALQGMRGVQLVITNNTDRPIVIDGNTAAVTIDKKQLTAASLPEIEQATCPPVTNREMFGRFVTTAATVGAVPTVQDQKLQDGPIRNRYGCDESRRINEISHFGKRVLWPKDSTGGVLYFDTAASLKGLPIQVPVHTLFIDNDCAILTVQP